LTQGNKIKKKSKFLEEIRKQKFKRAAAVVSKQRACVALPWKGK